MTIARDIRTTIGTLLLLALMVPACGVTEPDTGAFQDVRSFSWPTRTGTSMKYQTFLRSKQGVETTTERWVTIEYADPSSSSFPYHYGERMYVIDDTSEQTSASTIVHFLPKPDSLIVKQGGFGGEIALLAPIEEGHRWYSARDSSWQAEIVGLYAWRKVEGKVYENVVAVRYRRTNPLGGTYDDEEYIRFFGEGVGEIMTIRNVYPESSSGASTVPRQDERTVLLETSTPGI